jgi:hypothetical protein
MSDSDDGPLESASDGVSSPPGDPDTQDVGQIPPDEECWKNGVRYHDRHHMQSSILVLESSCDTLRTRGQVIRRRPATLPLNFCGRRPIAAT